MEIIVFVVVYFIALLFFYHALMDVAFFKLFSNKWIQILLALTVAVLLAFSLQHQYYVNYGILLCMGIFVLFNAGTVKKRVIAAGVFGSLLIVAIITGIFYNNKISTQEKSEEVNKMQETKNSNQADSDFKLDIGVTELQGLWSQTFVYPSNIDDTFVIDVCLPSDYDASVSYPVVYLTDCYWRRGDYAAIKELYESGKTKEFILVGIGYPDDYDFDTIRQRDLLREPDKFLNMIVNGVIPYIESNYKTDQDNRTFCGASFGGYFMVYSLLQSNGLTKDIFKNYILASPTFWESTDGKLLTDYESEYAENTDTLKANVYLTVGGLEGAYDFLQPIQDFVDTVTGRNYKDFNLTYKVYEGKDHYTVWVPSLLDGLTMYLAN